MKSLADELGIEHVEETVTENLPALVTETSNTEIIASDTAADQEKDYKLARKTFTKMIDQGSKVLEDVGKLAKTSENPEMYKVYAHIMKTLGDTTNNLYDLHKKNKEIADTSVSNKIDETNVSIDKAVFVGTTADLLKQIKDMK